MVVLVAELFPVAQSKTLFRGNADLVRVPNFFANRLVDLARAVLI